LKRLIGRTEYLLVGQRIRQFIWETLNKKKIPQLKHEPWLGEKLQKSLSRGRNLLGNVKIVHLYRESTVMPGPKKYRSLFEWI